MKEYRVSWSIDVDGETPEEAVLVARMILADNTRDFNVFEVSGSDDEIAIIYDNLQTGEITNRFPHG